MRTSRHQRKAYNIANSTVLKGLRRVRGVSLEKKQGGKRPRVSWECRGRGAIGRGNATFISDKLTPEEWAGGVSMKKSRVGKGRPSTAPELNFFPGIMGEKMQTQCSDTFARSRTVRGKKGRREE